MMKFVILDDEGCNLMFENVGVFYLFHVLAFSPNNLMG
jgi:hypothetical protein